MSDEALIAPADIARLAGVGRAAVSNWRRRHPDFPEPVSGTGASPLFRRADVEGWLQRRGKLTGSESADRLWRVIEADDSDGAVVGSLADIADALRGSVARERLDPAVRAALEELADESPDELIDDLTTRLFERQQRQHLATPPDLAALMAEIAAPENATVFDPACGPGNVLRAAAERGAAELLGQEIDPALARLADARLASYAPTRIVAGDALRADAFPVLRADVVVCDPPFGYRDWGHEELGVDPRWEYGYPVKAEPELAWLQHCLAHVRPGGTVVIALPAGVASRRSGRTIRQALLRRGVVRAVIALPPGVLMSTGIPIHLWVLRPGSDPVSEPVLLVDARQHRPERRGNVDWPELSRAVLAAWRQFTDTGEVDEVAGVQRTVQAIELLDEDVDLTPARHLPVAAPQFDVAELEEERRRLVRLLEGLARQVPPVHHTKSDELWPVTTINDLARAGALVVRQQVGRLDLSEASSEGPLMWTGRDVAAGVGPTMRLVDRPSPDLMVLRPGDVVVASLVAGDGRPAVAVVDEAMLGEDVLLGPNLQLLRVDVHRLDPDFLAGYVRAGRSPRASSTTASGVHRLDVRRVEVPVLDIGSQRRLGTRFRRLREIEVGLREAYERGGGLVRQLAAGLADGALDLQEEPSSN